MRFLIDENAPLALVGLLRARGHDVDAVALIAHRAVDPDILAKAVREQRVLVTFDSDFGRHIYLDGMAAPPGVVYMRGRPEEAAEVVAAFMRLFDADPSAPDGHFVIIEPDGKFRALPLSQRTSDA